MGLTVTRVRVSDFRNYREFELEPDPALTVLVGPNAAGKTNLVEAVQLLTEAESFRKPAWGDTVRQGEKQAELSLEASGDGRHLKIDLVISGAGRRTYRVNGKARRSTTQVSGILPCVIFTPDDLRFVKDSAEKRRGALDSLGAQLSPSFTKLKLDYERVLRQRNSLLKEQAATAEDLGPWNEQLISFGARLVESRRRLFDRVEQALARIYPDLSQGQHIESRYVPSWEREAAAGEPGDAAAAMREHLERKRGEERARKVTLTGPHRDEVVFEIEGRDARAFGSQGQQRTIALAWKIAEVEVISEVASQRPVLLLDDVMSELDERRRHALASFVGDAAQTLITTTNLGYFDGPLLDRARVVALG